MAVVSGTATGVKVSSALFFQMFILHVPRHPGIFALQCYVEESCCMLVSAKSVTSYMPTHSTRAHTRDVLHKLILKLGCCQYSFVDSPAARVTGVHMLLQKNAATKRNDYHGELRKLVNALIRTLYGGQIVVDQQTFIGITGPDGGVKVTRLDAYELDVQHRCVLLAMLSLAILHVWLLSAGLLQERAVNGRRLHLIAICLVQATVHGIKLEFCCISQSCR